MAGRGSRRRDDRVKSGERTITNGLSGPTSSAPASSSLPDVRNRPSLLFLAGSGVVIFLVGCALAWLATVVWPFLGDSGLNPRPVAPGSSKVLGDVIPTVIDRYVDLHRNNDPAALELIEPSGLNTDNPVTPDEAERIEAETFLRLPLTIVAVRAGEPAGRGRQKSAPGRYTLVTRGGATGPPVHIREGDRIASQGRRVMVNPDIIVEVRNGRILALRPELHEGP
jgi:hypothetical protein